MVVAVPLAGEVGEMPGVALMKSNMLARRVGIISEFLGAPQTCEAGVPRLDARPYPLDVDRLCGARHAQDRRYFNREACRQANVLAVGDEPREFNVERVRSRR